jgi:4-carboxymuconolactone decarboxylase
MDDHERGMAVRRQVLGDAHVDRAEAGKDAFTNDFQAFITRYAWGGVWTRPGLDRRTRSCVTLAVLATLRCEEELAMHIRGARRNGVSPEEIAEVLLQVAVYAGVPAANTAFAVAQRTLAQAAPQPASGSAAGPVDGG